MMPRWNRTRFLLIALEVILLIAAVTGFLLWLEYRNADLRFPDWAEVGLSTEDGKNYRLSWPQLEDAERYAVKISRASGGKETGEVLWRGECEENSCLVGELPAEEAVIAITPVARFRTLFGTATRHGSTPFTVTAQLDAPAVEGLEYSMDAETQLLTARFDRQEPFSYALWMVSDGIQQKEREIESQCMRLLLRQQPVARDLRAVSAALKMISDMERIGDQAADIAEIARDIESRELCGQVPIAEMAKAAVEMVTDSVDAFVRGDESLAHAVIVADDKVDSLFLEMRSKLIQLISAGENGSVCLDLMMVAKYFERIGDHSVNVAQWVEYSLTGHYEEG